LEVQARVGLFTVPHPGVLAYDACGQPLVLHNSKKTGGKAVTSVAEFNDGQQPRVTWVPSSWAEGYQVVQNAGNDVALGGQWSFADNCQDFVNRAVTGRTGSPTRDLFLGLALLGLLAFVATR
jgi:hypothetical protein